MAKLKRPKKGKVPKLEEASNNLGEVKPTIKGLNFKIDARFYKEYKRFALEHDMSLTALLKESFEHFKEAKNS